MRPKDLARALGLDRAELERICARYPARISSHVLAGLGEPGGPLWRQFVPDSVELEDSGEEDPLREEAGSPVPGLIHRYPDRVLFCVSNECAVYCRHCMRKRKVGRPFVATEGSRDRAVRYIAASPGLREVVLSGGDPLMLAPDRLLGLLERLRGIAHVEVLRIHTRVPCAAPERITPDLAAALSRFAPLFLNIQANHFTELTPEAGAALSLLADSGIPLGSQTVLLRGVNDDSRILARLFTTLLRHRVRPYYLHSLDRVRGAAHFAVPLSRGLRIMEQLRGGISGMAVPRFMVDLPGGGGKMDLLPQGIVGRRGSVWLIRDYRGRVVEVRE
ncbi:MAG: KamA family radical SAM protein [Desulfatibacillaceae bacterium]